MAMDIRSLRDNGKADGDLVRDGEPLAVRIERVNGDGSILGTLLADALDTTAGTRVQIRQASGGAGKSSLTAIVGLASGLEGRISGPGDVVSFTAAIAVDGIAVVGPVSAREHRGLRAKTQVLTAMVRASPSRISARGPYHGITVADGTAAAVVGDIASVIAVLRQAAERPWPGGSAGLIMRAGNGKVAEYFLGYDRDENHLAEELDANRVLDGQRIEVIPAWRLPAGRDQTAKELGIGSDPISRHIGPVTRAFMHESLKGAQGFLPCLLIVTDEEEWAFKARTGRSQRCVIGLQPILRRTPIPVERLPSAVRNIGGRPNGILCLYDEATMEARMYARQAAAEPEAERPSALRYPMPPRQLGRGLMRR